MITARFLPKYPKRINVTGGLTKTEANGVITIGFDYTDVDAAVAAAEAAANSAAASYISFDTRYLGAKGSDPITDNQGNALITGAQYWNTVSNVLKVYNGAAWTSSAGGNVNGPLSSASGNIAVFDSSGGDSISDTGINARSLSDGALLNAVRAAESTGSGVSADGRIFVDLLNSTTTLDTDNSADFEFVKGGVQPTSAPGTYADAAYGAQSGNWAGWTGFTILNTITLAGVDQGKTERDYVRVTFRAGTGGGCTFGYVFIGVYGATDSFDPAYPIVPLLFDGAKSAAVAAGATAVATGKFTIPAGKAIIVSQYISAGGFIAKITKTNWSTSYKAATNEPAKVTKTGYTLSTDAGGLERIETALAAYDNATVVSAELPTSSAPSKADMVAFLEGETAGSSDLTLSLSRDGATWKDVSWSDYYSFNGKRGIAAFGVDLTSDAGTGSALYWKAVTANNRQIKICDIGLRQAAGVFSDVPSVPLVSRDPVVTYHNEATPLGYNVGDDAKYGRLWGFTQDFEVTGPTRFAISLRVGLEHNGPTSDYGAACTIALAVKYAVDSATMGAKVMNIFDTDGFLNNSANWLEFDSGNLLDLEHHYLNTYVVVTTDKMAPGIYRFEVAGYAVSGLDSPLVAGRAKVQFEEAYGISVTEFKYNKLEIVATPLR